MEHADWASPKRSRGFLAAALVVAVAGTMLEARFGGSDIPAWDTASEAKLSSSAAESSPSASVGDSALVASAPAHPDRDDPFTAEGADLRDAVASPSLSPSSWADQAGRSAAFAGPAGRLPGAYAPVAAPSSQAARRRVSVAGAFGAERSGLKERASRPSLRAAASAGRDASSSRPAVSAGSSHAARPDLRTPAERFFSMAGLQGADASLRGAAVSGSAAAAEGSTPGRRQRAPRAHLHPALLSRLLGLRPLKAPKAVAPPALRPWARPIPAAGPDGAPIETRPLGLAAAEEATPPPDCKRAGPHWDAAADGSARWLHDGKVWGRAAPEGWAWAAREGGRLWLWPEKGEAPLLRHEEHWWLADRGLWFLMHDGAPWGEQYLRDWGSEGFVHPSGARMIYSADGSRVGLVEADAGAVLYDAATGEELGRWTPAQLPKPRGPSVPSELPPLR
jgi:hypothetical protein